ncbi:LysR family transcriptional regulator [Enterococcus cecorum]|nr:LysR family transcriptional regulator [Enterococcus cecorum]CAI3469290.1 LysR family transcriptional regulator [Enterococcus cecorum]CAI3500685.1 LysR family transcriptional regulator [Enterococcus cecorum]
MYQALLKGQLDLAIVGMMNPLYDDQIEILPIAQKQFKIVVGRHHPLAKQKSVAFSELVEEKFVVLNEQYIHPKAMQKLAKQAGFTPKVIYQNSDLNILKGMIKEGVGIGFLVEIAVDEQKDELVCLEIADKNQPSFHISLLSRKNQPASVSQQVVQQILEENLLS